MNYPKKKTAFIGLFVMDVNYQNKGISSKVIAEAFLNYDGKETWTDESGVEWNKAVK